MGQEGAVGRQVNRHLIPGIGAHRLEKLTPEYVERLYAKLQRGGLSPGGVHHVHRTLRAALNEAVRRSHLTRNPVLLAKAPKLDEEEVEPYNVPDQHVTDTMRSQVASQVGELIWDSPADGDDQAAIVVRRESLATVLAAIEECIAGHHGGTDQSPGLLAGVAELRATLSPATARRGKANESSCPGATPLRRENLFS
jgi:hypothetical protein